MLINLLVVKIIYKVKKNERKIIKDIFGLILFLI